MTRRLIQTRTLLFWGSLIFSGFSTPQVLVAEAAEPSGIQNIEKLPFNLPSLDLSKRQKYNQLVSNAQDFGRFRKALTMRIVAIRARVTPKAPLDPRFPSWFHGSAFVFTHDKQRGLAVPTALIQDADRLEFRTSDGNWKLFSMPTVCKGAELVLIEDLTLEIAALEEDPFGLQRPLSAANSEQIQINTPLFALSNLEGVRPTLDHGTVTGRGDGALKDAWFSALKLSAGTPLVNASGEVLLVRIVRGTAVYDLHPGKAMECSEEESAP